MPERYEESSLDIGANRWYATQFFRTYYGPRERLGGSQTAARDDSNRYVFDAGRDYCTELIPLLNEAPVDVETPD